MERKRARDLGIKIGRFPTGRFNAITDVKGVEVGHSTIIRGAPGQKIVRTGVTAILPSDGDVFHESVIGGSFVLNGAGEISGLTQVKEWDLIETPILLTNTLSVGTCSDAVVTHMVEKYHSIRKNFDVIIPLVGECDDSWLNDISGQHVKAKHVEEAIRAAKSGPVEEGCVGGGTGMITCDFKAGIGTSSRKLPASIGGYTIGVLVMSNFGEINDLRIDGCPVGQILAKDYAHLPKRKDNYGSIICVVATDAPLLGHQLARIAKRAALGIGRAGSYAAHGSGEIILAFSTANKVIRNSAKMFYKMKILQNNRLNPLYEAVMETTEEAICNSLFKAREMTGANGNYSPAIPLEKVQKIMRDFYALKNKY